MVDTEVNVDILNHLYEVIWLISSLFGYFHFEWYGLLEDVLQISLLKYNLQNREQGESAQRTRFTEQQNSDSGLLRKSARPPLLNTK